MREFRGKTALITGASSGIGAAIARQLAEQGASLILVARRAGRLQSQAAEWSARYSVRVEWIAQDLVAPGAAEAIAAVVSERGMTVDILVNNAGIGYLGRFADAEWDWLHRMMQLNMLAVVELTWRLLPGMRARGSGAILNVSSMAGFQPLPYFQVYGATKAFVTSFSCALWREVREDGVDVCALCPGPVETEFFTAGRIALRRVPGPKQDADTVAALALRGLRRRRPAQITSWGLHALHTLVKWLPRRVVIFVAERIMRPVESAG